MRVLWVKNHAVFARMAGRFLAGHDVTVVPSVAAARAALTDGQFDAVLLDYDLDDGNGVMVIDFIHALPGRLVVVAASAHTDGNAALLAAGADAECPKAQFADVGAVLAAVTRGRAGGPRA